MMRLAFIVHLFVGTTLAGSAMVFALTMGWDTMKPVIIAALIGWLISLPVSWLLARKIQDL